MIEHSHLKTLKQLCILLGDLSQPWAITGSLGLALQGVAVDVDDIDLQTNERGAYLIQERLSDYTVEPVTFRESERIRSHLGQFAIDGMKVEVIGNMQKRTPNGEWSQPPDLPALIHPVTVDELLVPVLDLAYEAEAYEALGRVEKAEMIRQTIKSGSD